MSIAYCSVLYFLFSFQHNNLHLPSPPPPPPPQSFKFPKRSARTLNSQGHSAKVFKKRRLTSFAFSLLSSSSLPLAPYRRTGRQHELCRYPDPGPASHVVPRCKLFPPVLVSRSRRQAPRGRPRPPFPRGLNTGVQGAAQAVGPRSSRLIHPPPAAARSTSRAPRRRWSQAINS